MNILKKFKPAVPKKGLFFAAGIFWSFAGSMLLYRSLSFLTEHVDQIIINITIGIAGGGLFYFGMFRRITPRHIKRIKNIKIKRPCLFSFFDFKSYILVGTMITMSIVIKNLEIINPVWLYTYLIVMGIPLLLSSLRFFRAGIQYQY